MCVLHATLSTKAISLRVDSIHCPWMISKPILGGIELKGHWYRNLIVSASRSRWDQFAVLTKELRHNKDTELPVSRKYETSLICIDGLSPGRFGKIVRGETEPFHGRFIVGELIESLDVRDVVGFVERVRLGRRPLVVEWSQTVFTGILAVSRNRTTSTVAFHRVTNLIDRGIDELQAML